MQELKAMVQKELKNTASSRKLLRLSNEIFSWYEEGGERLVKERIDHRVKSICADFKKQAEDIKIVARLKKRRSKRR